MRDVVIIGGGLTGLAAARELDRAGITFTLIEVKPRLGGSIGSKFHDGFILDSGPMLTQDTLDAPFLTDLGLKDQVYIARHDEDGKYLAFKAGMGVLIDRLAGPL
ncbi:MAG TPA: FAD-dependent oxidoreductase, partial [Phototrophicaceae bacterium]|nr:FAD-dependent oxidoreductase [Phototrophicaceae bacterium]